MKNIKILIATLLFLLLFAISCSNEDKTGGGTENYDSNTKTNNYVPTPNPNPDPTPTPPPAIPGQLTASATSNIEIIVTDDGMHTAGSIAFAVNPPELKNTGDLTVSIESVNTNRLNKSFFLQFKPEDFNSLTPTSTKLTLSESGLKKTNQIMNSASLSSLNYSYDITFKFTTTSDTVSNKTATAKSTVRLYKYELVTAQMLEDMIKTTPKLTVSNRYQLYDNYEDSFDIDFSKLTYTAGLKTISINNASGTMTLPARETSTFSKLLCKLDSIKFGTDANSKFLSMRNSMGTITVSADGKVLTANYKFPLKREYIWDNNMTFATNEGLNIEFRLDKGKWR